MAEVFDKAFIEAQIASLKTQLTENTVARTKARESQIYSLDTGQSRQSVHRQQLKQLDDDRKSIIEELQYWQSMLCGGGGVYARPAF